MFCFNMVFHIHLCRIYLSTVNHIFVVLCMFNYCYGYVCLFVCFYFDWYGYGYICNRCLDKLVRMEQQLMLEFLYYFLLLLLSLLFYCYPKAGYTWGGKSIVTCFWNSWFYWYLILSNVILFDWWAK